MNRQELLVVVLLFVLLIGWGIFFRRPPQPPAPAAAGVAAVTNAPAAPVRAGGAPVLETPQAPVPVVATSAVPALVETAEPVPAHSALEETLEIANGVARLTVTSWGGGITAVELQEYRSALEKDSDPMTLRFDGRPALSLTGFGDLSPGRDFVLEPGADGNGARVSRVTADGVRFERTLALGDGYGLTVTDTFTNGGTQPVTLPGYGLMLGPMQMVESKARTRGISYLGVDTLAGHGGEKVRYWGKKLPALFGQQRSGLGCGRVDSTGLPREALQSLDQPVDWAAAKNKFFVQILAPENGAAGCDVRAERDMSEPANFKVTTVSADLRHAAAVVAPGESITRTAHYYVGPKKQALLVQLGNHQEDVMQFGMLRWLCKKLLWTLNALHHMIPNYGIAIILLTAIVRIIFWPVTHKSTESMKKMQTLQPEVTALREKYKDKPQKMNQEVMALYKENKVNPMSGCLPIVVQIPVFIALFTVLRSAVELRFAPFLWIKDLSEPEGLLAGMIPVVGSLNILPVFMTVTMVLQQQLTPSTGDPQQRKMMMMMPVIMLFIFYSMPSALVLYWSVSQCFSIGQMLLQRKMSAAKAAAAA